jgi:hypothetical protein
MTDLCSTLLWFQSLLMGDLTPGLAGARSPPLPIGGGLRASVVAGVLGCSGVVDCLPRSGAASIEAYARMASARCLPRSRWIPSRARMAPNRRAKEVEALTLELPRRRALRAAVRVLRATRGDLVGAAPRALRIEQVLRARARGSAAWTQALTRGMAALLGCQTRNTQAALGSQACWFRVQAGSPGC